MSRIRIRLPRGEWFFDDARQLGRAGGFGEVFEGEDALGGPAAVKRLKLTAAEAAHRELAIAAELAGRRLQHVLVPLDSGQDAESGDYFVVMPRADGSLDDELAIRGPVASAEVVDILRQISSGLLEIPDIVHRDLKPANVLRNEDRWKIADFGIARFVEAATSLNTLKECLTPAFAAPEQWNNEHATAATDIYALSCIAHVLASGAPPFRGPAMADYQRQHLNGAPPPFPSSDPRLQSLVAAGLRKPPAGRPTLQRVSDVLRDIAANPTVAPALAALQSANAAEAHRIGESAARAAEERRLTRERNQLVETGKAILLDVLAELERVARHNAPDADIRRSGNGALGITLGQAFLDGRPGEVVPSNATFPASGWTPVAIGRIDVHQRGRNEWRHGATLWYMQLRGGSEYRWYEVSYKRHALSRGPLIGPFPIQDIGNDAYAHADAAAGPGMHTIELDHSPTPIDDEATGAFVERWLSRLTQAYNGRLRPF